MRATPFWLAAPAAALLAVSSAAQPLGGATWQLDPSQKSGTDLIEYRPLVREDFRAPAPPPRARSQAQRLGAATCSYLVPDRESLRIAATPRKRRGGSWEYVAKPDRLHFRGAMDRRCSWWNPRQEQLPPDYVLAHEQIHFALTEIHARRLNQRGAELVRKLTFVDRDADGAIAASERALQDFLRDESEALLARNDRFDADTSLGVRREAQSAWHERVAKELAETERFAR
jgi:hypothetical protein